MASGTHSENYGKESGLFGWIDGSLATVVLGSIAVVVAAGLVQVSFGTYSMTLAQAWRAVFDHR